MSWQDITAAERDEYSPITGRLLEKYRVRDRAIRHNILLGPMANSTPAHEVINGSNEDTWESMGGFGLFVPDYHDGGTTTLDIVARLSLENSGAGVTSTCKWRLKHGSDVSGEQTQGASGTGLKTWDRQSFSLTFTPTPGAVNVITVEGRGSLDSGIVEMWFQWDNTHEGILSTV